MNNSICNKRYLVFLIPLFLFFFGCSGCDNDQRTVISLINHPQELPSEIKKEIFFLTKTNEHGTVISVYSLDLLINETYQKTEFVNDVDISGDGQYAIYTQIISSHPNRPIWLWENKLGDNLERKVFGWDDNYSDITISNPSFSIDDQMVYFSVTWLGLGKTGLAKVNRSGKDFQILETDISLAEGPEVSPDGSMILVTCAGFNQQLRKPGFQICLLDGDGNFIKYISNQGDLHGSYYFLPDGKSIVYGEFESGGIFGIIDRPEYNFYSYKLDGSKRTLLLDWEIGVKGFSHDSQNIIFEGRPNSRTPWGIYIINIDGTNLRHLTYFDEFLEDWYSDIVDH